MPGLSQAGWEQQLCVPMCLPPLLAATGGTSCVTWKEQLLLWRLATGAATAGDSDSGVWGGEVPGLLDVRSDGQWLALMAHPTFAVLGSVPLCPSPEGQPGGGY